MNAQQLRVIIYQFGIDIELHSSYFPFPRKLTENEYVVEEFVLKEWMLGLRPIPDELGAWLIKLNTMFHEERKRIVEEMRQQDKNSLVFNDYYIKESFAELDPIRFHKFGEDLKMYRLFIRCIQAYLKQRGLSCSFNPILITETICKKLRERPTPPPDLQPANQNRRSIEEKQQMMRDAHPALPMEGESQRRSHLNRLLRQQKIEDGYDDTKYDLFRTGVPYFSPVSQSCLPLSNGGT